jgi:outer membrane PBP1 activator LpoA protein
MLELLTDIVITILILVSIAFIANVKDNKKNTKREDDEITDDDLTELAKCNDINWSRLSNNPNAVKLLKKRFEYEKCLSDAEYKKLPNKIDWVYISFNNGAVELIKERIEYEKLLGDKYEYQSSRIYTNKRNKIDWEYMLVNDNAIELLREKIKYQKSLNSDEYARLQDKIFLCECSSLNNKNIMILMKDYYLSNK